ncbi:magnesium transporter [Candidatus Deianiraea vastatrix]|nr:magnesium transporter [Candidatus Deianiraea vastatrix]
MNHIKEHNYNMHDILHAIRESDIEKFRHLITSLNPYDKAEIFNSISNDDFILVIKSVYDLVEAEALVELSEHKRLMVVEEVGTDGIAASLSRLENDDIVYFVSALPHEYCESIVNALPRSERKLIRLALTYTKDQVGRLMDVDILKFKKDATILDIKVHLNNIGDDLSEDTRDVFIVGDDDVLIGMVSLFSILTTDEEQSVMSVLNHDFKTVYDTDDKSEVAYTFRKYNLTSLPVIARDQRIIGSISSDSALEILQSESDEDLLKLGGVAENYEDINIFKKAYSRFIWLFFNLCAAFISASVIGKFSHTISKYSILAIFLPVVASIGGNSGNQTVILIIRMIALKTINKLNARYIMTREIMIGVVNSLLFLIVGLVFGYFVSHDLHVAQVFAVALACNILLSSILGFAIPMTVRRLNIDPAPTSSIFLTTMTDFLGFLMFLSIASIFFK